MHTKLVLVALLSTIIIVESGAQISERVRINGYSSFEYENQFSDDGEGDPNGSFDADLIDIVINVDVTSRLRFSTDLTWEHGTATENDYGNVAVEYAFPEYTVRDWLKFRVGKMFTPFGIYNEIHTAKPAFLAVKEPLSTNKPEKFGGDMRFYPRWGVGMSVLGNFSVNTMEFEYHVQVSNGSSYDESFNTYEEDDNKQKALSARLLFMPTTDLKIGVSTYSDKLSVLDSLGDDTGARDKIFSISGHAEYSHNNFGLEVEYITGQTDYSVGSSLNKHAIEAMVYYTFIDRLTPYFRYEFLDPNKDVEEDEAKMLSFGVNTRIDKNFFLKLQVNSISSNDSNETFEGISYSEFQAAIVLGF